VWWGGGLTTPLIKCQHITEVTQDEMGRACSTHEKDKKCILNFRSQNLKGRDYSGDLGIDERILLKLILRKYSFECGLDSSDSG
jgi:hypothetical protein